MNPYNIGIIFVVLGVLCYFLIFIISRRTEDIKIVHKKKDSHFFESLLPARTHGVLVLSEGGRVEYANDKARTDLQISDDAQTDLETIAFRTGSPRRFFDLCLREGQEDFSLDDANLRIASLKFVFEEKPYTALLLQRDEIDEDQLASASGFDQEVLQIFSDLTISMKESTELEELIHSILVGLSGLLQTDWAELTIWDAEISCMLPYHLQHSVDGEKVLEASQDYYLKNEGYSGYIASHLENLVKNGKDLSEAFEDLSDSEKQVYQTYLGYPLLSGENFLGTLEIGLLEEELSTAEIAKLDFFTAQTALVLQSFQHSQDEDERRKELESVNQLVRSISDYQTGSDIYEMLIEAVQDIVDVEVIGFLIYDQTRQVLEGKWPFIGLPPQFVEMFQTEIVPQSPAEKLLMEQKVISVSNASDNYQWENLGLIHLAQAASLKDSLLVPLSAGGRMLGYIQASNHRSGSRSFNDQEIWMLSLAAAQAALIIENAMLSRQNFSRSKKFDAIRNVSHLTSSTASIDNVLTLALKEVGLLLEADAALLLLFDKSRGVLKVHQSSAYGTLQTINPAELSLGLSDSQFPFSVMQRLHPILSDSVMMDDQLIPFYKANFEKEHLDSAMILPLYTKDSGLGELWLLKKDSSAFSQNDLHFSASVCTQLAFYIEQNALLGQTDEKLRQQNKQLNSLRQLSLEISASQDINYLLQLVFDETMRVINADYGNFLMFEDSGEMDGALKIVSFLGSPRFDELTSAELDVLRKGESVIISDLEDNDLWMPDNAVSAALFVPIRYFENDIGAILLYAKDAAQFDDSSLEITQSIAAQASVVAGTSRQYEEQKTKSVLLSRQLRTMESLFQVSQKLRSNRPIGENLEQILNSLGEITAFQRIVISVYDPVNKMLRHSNASGFSEEGWREMRYSTPAWLNMKNLLQPAFQINSAYFIPAEKEFEGVEEFLLLDDEAEIDGDYLDSWQVGDLLLMPLMNANGTPLGLINVSKPFDGRRPDMSTIQALELFGMQASLMIEGQRYITALSTNLSEAEANQIKMQSSVRTIKQQVPLLLKQQMDYEIKIRRLDAEMRWVLLGQQVNQLLSQAEKPESVLPVLADMLLRETDFRTILITEQFESGAKLLQTAGQSPETSKLEAQLGKKNPIRSMFSERRTILEPDVRASSTWKDSNLLKTLQSRSFIALPFSPAENRQMGLLMVGDQVLETYPQTGEVLQRFADQLARGFRTILDLQSTRSHLREINLLLDFSRKLAGLDTRSILKTLLENIFPVISNAQAGWVGLWDEEAQTIHAEYASGYVADGEITRLAFALMDDDLPETQSEPLVSRIFRLGQPKRVREIHFSRDYNLPKDDLMRYRKALGSKLPLSSVLVPIFSGAEKVGILVLDSFEASRPFSEQDLELAEAMLHQVSMALENAKLFVNVEQRSAQLKGLTQAAEIMTSSLQRDELVKTLLEQLASVLPYETATLWLREQNNLKIADANGFEDNESRVGIEVQIEDSRLFQDMIQAGQALLVGDVREDERFSAMIVPENFSWLGIPLLSQAEVIGLIALEKKEANYYTPDHVLAGTTMASQAAVSLENARIFEESVQRSDELDQRSRRLSLLNELSSVLNATLNADEIIQDSIQKLCETLDVSRILYVSHQNQNEFSMLQEYPQFAEELQVGAFHSPLLDHLSLSQGIFNTFDIEYETGFDQALETYFASRKVRSLLIVPILTASDLFGWLFLCREELTRFGQSEIDLLSTIGNQVAIALQNANLYLTTNQMTDELEQRVTERTAELQIEHKNTQTLLSIITELSSSMEIDEVLSRTLNILNQSTGAEQSVVLMADGTSRTFVSGEKLIKVDNLGDIFSIFPEQEVAGWVLQKRETIVAGNIEIDERWNFGPRLKIEFAYASLLAIPLVLGDQVLGTLFLAHTEEDFFSGDILNLVEAAARQISIAINNAELFDLSQDQSDRLFDMLRDQQIDSSRSVAILEAVADGVLVTDSTDMISLFNVSAERILELSANQVVGQPLSKFAGLFGSSSDRWLKTIQKWSDTPMLTEDGETYAEQLELDNGHIVLVHLAPVILGENFLGTVSIFRDITQEVLVDRLKSDFVANVSHELRTPMTSIKGYVEILLMGAAGELDEQQKDFLNVIKENTERLKILVDDLLDISYIEAGKTKLNFEAFDLKAIVEESLTEIRRVSQSENRLLEFSVSESGELPLVYGDVEKIRQVVDSLVKNGYIYTPENGNVQVNLRVVSEMVQVDVVDDGIGISPENHDRIFERFYRGEHPLVLASAGTGLGLAISKILVEMHQGEIWFESPGVDGKGSTFSFTIPIYEKKES